MIIVDKVENGPVLICPDVHRDDRGYFYESFNDAEFREKVCNTTFVQDNQSCSSYGVLRGMHFQEGEHAQAKLVRVVKGAVLDVVLDIRKDSLTYGNFYDYLLTADNHRQLFVPRGFAHGFLSLANDTIFQYKCDNFYNKESEGSFKYDSFGFDWDKYIDQSHIIVSDKDLIASIFHSASSREISKDDLIRHILSNSLSSYQVQLEQYNIYADILENGKGVQVKLISTSPSFESFDVFTLEHGFNIIAQRTDNGLTQFLPRDLNNVIRFYYKNE